jgi:hypothetical protein
MSEVFRADDLTTFMCRADCLEISCQGPSEPVQGVLNHSTEIYLRRRIPVAYGKQILLTLDVSCVITNCWKKDKQRKKYS